MAAEPYPERGVKPSADDELTPTEPTDATPLDADDVVMQPRRQGRALPNLSIGRLVTYTAIITAVVVVASVVIADRPWAHQRQSSKQVQPFVPGAKSYNLAGLQSVAIGPDNKIIAVGSTTSDGYNNAALAIKVNPDGSLVWSKAFGDASGNVEFDCAAVAPDGAVIAVGQSAAMYGDFAVKYPEQGHGGALVARIGPDGTLLWSKVFGGKSGDSFSGVALTPDGGLVAVGETNSVDGDFPDTHDTAANGYMSSDAVIMKLNVDGTIAWSTVFGGSNNDSFASVAVGEDGNVVAVGSTNSTDGDFTCKAQSGCGMAVKVGADGALAWARTFVDGYSAQLAGVTIAQNSSIIAVGKGNNQAWAIRLTAAGGTAWTKHYLQGRSSTFGAVAVAPGGVVAVGQRTNANAGGSVFDTKDSVVARIKPNGGVAWESLASGTSSVAVSADGSVATAGGVFITRLTSNGKTG